MRAAEDYDLCWRIQVETKLVSSTNRCDAPRRASDQLSTTTLRSIGSESWPWPNYYPAIR